MQTGSVLLCDEAPKGRPNTAQASGLGQRIVSVPSPERAIYGVPRTALRIEEEMALGR